LNVADAPCAKQIKSPCFLLISRGGRKTSAHKRMVAGALFACAWQIGMWHIGLVKAADMASAVHAGMTTMVNAAGVGGPFQICLPM
jgi:hypothetical protein